MSLTVKKTGGDFVLPPAGTHRARCYRVVDLGTHNRPFNGQDKWTHQVLIGFELCDELMDDGRPFTVGSTFTASLHEKANLRHTLESWRGKAFTEQELEGFQLNKLISAPALVTVAHEKSKQGDKTFANVKAITPLAKGMQPPPLPVNPTSFYEIESGQSTVFLSLPEWLQKKISASREWYAGSQAGLDASAGEAPERPADAGEIDESEQIPF